MTPIKNYDYRQKSAYVNMLTKKQKIKNKESTSESEQPTSLWVSSPNPTFQLQIFSQVSTLPSAPLSHFLKGKNLYNHQSIIY